MSPRWGFYKTAEIIATKMSPRLGSRQWFEERDEFYKPCPNATVPMLAIWLWATNEMRLQVTKKQK